MIGSSLLFTQFQPAATFGQPTGDSVNLEFSTPVDSCERIALGRSKY